MCVVKEMSEKELIRRLKAEIARNEKWVFITGCLVGWCAGIAVATVMILG